MVLQSMACVIYLHHLRPREHVVIILGRPHLWHTRPRLNGCTGRMHMGRWEDAHASWEPLGHTRLMIWCSS